MLLIKREDHRGSFVNILEFENARPVDGQAGCMTRGG
jgi:hypothetical protein